MNHESQYGVSLSPIIFMDSLTLLSFSVTTLLIILHTGTSEVINQKKLASPPKLDMKGSSRYLIPCIGTKTEAIGGGIVIGFSR